MHALLSKLSLRISAPLVLSLPVLMAVAVLSLIAFWQARSAANKLAGDQLVEIHGRIDQRLSDLLIKSCRIARTMHSCPNSKGSSTESRSLAGSIRFHKRC